MGARVFHHPLAIRVYEWVEIFNEYIHQLIEEDLQSVYVNGSRVEILICFYLDKRCQNKKRASFQACSLLFYIEEVFL